LIEYRSGLISLLSPDARGAFRRTVLRLLGAIFSSGHPEPLITAGLTPSHCAVWLCRRSDLARRGSVRPVVAATFALAGVAEAQRELALRAHVRKIVVIP
jgi:NADPH:quinone reductase-like Zn-dependent oxidoreductase